MVFVLRSFYGMRIGTERAKATKAEKVQPVGAR
jgi:hypothetical protein